MLQQFFTTLLVSLYSLVQDLGLSIIVMTILIRSLLLPITLPTLKARKKLENIKPKLDKLKKKYGKNKKKMQKAQMELYKKYNINPLSGCLPQILQIIILIGLYRTLNDFLNQSQIQGLIIKPNFLWLDLTKPDHTYILPVLAAIIQFVLALMIAPGGEVRDIIPNKSKSKKKQQENKEEEDTAEMAKTMQQQMIFIMPLMTGFVAAKFPAGLALYWVITNGFSIIQQYFVSGWGGLEKYLYRIKLKLNL
ncbi:MAG: YidC/Oxa1 family membrane protein insertase [Patescibacteria group bacterium]|nr:YidC/Oxa1 family membrane protein insertase [Patescibacteria group bacterium]